MARAPTQLFAVIACTAVLLLAPGEAHAFHSGGVADCDGCHTMHGGGDGSAVVGAYLLQGGDASSRCLYCHSGISQAPHSVLSTGTIPGSAPANYTPGGEFAWLGKSFSWGTGATVKSSPGERHGHNVVARDFGLDSDTTNRTAPGGWYPANELSCTSCHDPHARYRINGDGNLASSGSPIVGSGSYGDPDNFRQPTSTGAVGSYRLLAGAGYRPASAQGQGLAPFSRDAPVALAPFAYNKSERTTEVRVAYGAGMSEWCGNCHGALHTPYALEQGTLLHPSGSSAKLTGGGGNLDIYNRYVRTGDLTGAQASSYWSLVPYEEGTTDRAALAAHARSDGSAKSGPSTGQENVMCLSCHRAHASGWDHAMRWNYLSEFVVAAGQWPGVDASGSIASNPVFAQGRTVAETRGAMYDRDPSTYAPFETTLCNKCHAK